MGLNEIKDLARRGHVIGCHTAHHVRMRPTLDAAILLEEIAEAKKELEMRLGHPVNAFAWVGGEPDTYRADALQMLCEAGFSWIFTTQSSLFRVGGDTRAIHRTVLEPDLPFPLFLAKINGLSDLMHCGRRKASLNAMRL
jgi:peptidoglycan/xylan/chitin deacetylase (PgdA/CDA1 family)